VTHLDSRVMEPHLKISGVKKSELWSERI
jgi:hypothetical protein